ncbi:winged helix-turn-helix domain-containing protein [Burkholderia alba]|uniref:winged helix-turn-helix domain-containing protein n=1 Tax=Burkholderia alba TaxID=2683677 RepID=UPI002B05506A|nr:helix-turn-helix domain-containing protein [Burkholderia alba]
MSKYQIDGSVVFDSQAMTLSRGGITTTLTANEAELLSILMLGTASKQAVIEQIWESKGLFVTEGSYHQLVRALRVKLDEQGLPRTDVKTLPRLGLRFVGLVEPLDPAPVAAVVPETPEPAPVIALPGAQAALAPGVAMAPAPLDAPALLAAGVTVDARAAGRPSNARSPRRRAAYFAIYVTLAAWAGVLTWQTFRHRDNTFRFRFQQTIDGIHYFSDGRMDQPNLLKAIDISPLKGSFVYKIGLGSNDWLAVCPKSIYETPELCQSYFIEKKSN